MQGSQVANQPLHQMSAPSLQQEVEEHVDTCRRKEVQVGHPPPQWALTCSLRVPHQSTPQQLPALGPTTCVGEEILWELGWGPSKEAVTACGVEIQRACGPKYHWLFTLRACWRWAW